MAILTKQTLLQNVIYDVEDFLQDPLNKQPQTLNKQPQIGIYNECDFQLQLAIRLQNSKNNYDNVYTEYRVTYDEIVHFGNPKYSLTPNQWPWPRKHTTAIHIDIVVEKIIDGQKVYVPIELKFKTKKVLTTLLAFDEINPSPQHSRVLYANQVAYTDNISKVWKDVHRIELLNHAFSKIAGGLVVFLTNGDNYWTPKREDSTFPNKVNSIEKGTKVTDNKSTFVMEGSYRTRWMPIQQNGFRAGIIVIP